MLPRAGNILIRSAKPAVKGVSPKHITVNPTMPSTGAPPPGAPSPTPPPGSPTGGPLVLQGPYAQQSTNAHLAYDNAVKNINQRRGSLMQQYGLTGTVDAEGHLTNQGIDPNNPYGLIQQAFRGQGRGYGMAEQNSANRGLGVGGGLAGQQEGELRQNSAVENLGIQRNFLQSIQDLIEAQQGAKYTRDSEDVNAGIGQTNYNIANRAFTEPDLSGGASGTNATNTTAGGGGGSVNTVTAPKSSAPSAVSILTAGAVPNVANASGGGGVAWGGQTFTKKAALAKFLASRGQSYKTWAANHPGAAQQLQ